MKNMLKSRFPRRCREGFVVFGLLLVGAASHRPVHAESALSDSEMKAQTGAAIHTDGPCKSTGDCKSQDCTQDNDPVHGNTGCTSIINDHFGLCTGNLVYTAAETKCTYPTTLNASCATNWSGKINDRTLKCDGCTTKGTVAARHNTC